MDSKTSSTNPLRFPLGPIAVFVAVIVVTLFSGNMLFENLRDGIKQDVQHSIAAVGTLKARQIHNWLDERYAESRILSDNSFFSHEVKLWMLGGAHNDTRRAQLAKRFDAFLKVHSGQAIVLYDTSGHVMLSAGERVPDAQAKRGAACTAAASGQLQFIDMHPDQIGFYEPVAGRWTLFGDDLSG